MQTSVIGLSVGYAMGQEGAIFDLEVANDWFTAFRDFCKLAPDTNCDRGAGGSRGADHGALGQHLFQVE